MTTDPQAEKSDLLSRKEVLAALKDAMNNQPTYDALEIISALPAIALDREMISLRKVIAIFEVEEAIAKSTFDQSAARIQRANADHFREMLSGALPVLETKKETP